MYALLALWSVLSTWLLLKIHNSQFTIRYSLFYLLTIIAGLYTHYFFAAVLITHNMVVLVWLIGKRRGARGQGGKGDLPLSPAPPATSLRTSLLPITHWIIIMITAALAYLPWLPIFIRQAGGRPGAGGSFLEFLVDAGRWLALGTTIESKTAVLPLIAAAILLVGGLVISRRDGTAVLNLLIPVLFMVMVGTTQPEFFKFLLVAVPFFCLLIASTMNREGRKERPGFFFATSALFAVSFLILLVGNGRSLQNLYFNPDYARADYRGMAARIEAENHPNAGIILNAPNQWEVFTYYHQEGAPVYPLPTGHPRRDDIDAKLTRIAGQHDRLYAIFWGDAQRDPERLVERWLDEHTFKATDEWMSDVRFVTYAVPTQPAPEMETTLSLSFGDSITLNGYTLAADKLAPGDIVQITLFWGTAVPLDTRYKVFLHLVDETGELITQRDSEPGGDLNPTTRWSPGEQIIDNHGLFIPTYLPPGNYQLFIGLYDLTDPNGRLPFQTETGPIDAYSIGTISVE